MNWEKEKARRLEIAEAKVEALTAQIKCLELELRLEKERLREEHQENVMRLQHADWVLKEGAYTGDPDVCRCCAATKKVSK